MENNIKLRKMNISDVESVCNLEKELIKVPWSKKLISELVFLKDSIAKVICINDKVIGYYSFNIVIDEAYINNLAIDREYQHKGYGNMLMLDLIQECDNRNINNITLEVDVNNKTAINLYKKFGFVSEGIRKNFYLNKIDAYIMWKRK